MPERIRYTKEVVKAMSIAEILQLVHDGKITMYALNDVSKGKMQNFIEEIFDKGILHSYLSLS